MIDCFKKQNTNFIEILFTEYCIIDSNMGKYFQQLIDNRELVARYDPIKSVNALCGMAYQKYKALEHPYPTLLDKIEKFGYDPKQLHHILRLEIFLGEYIDGTPYEICLKPEERDREYLIEVKKGLHTLEEARQLSKDSLGRIDTMKSRYTEKYDGKPDQWVEELFEEVKYKTLRDTFKEEVLEL